MTVPAGAYNGGTDPNCYDQTAADPVLGISTLDALKSVIADQARPRPSRRQRDRAAAAPLARPSVTPPLLSSTLGLALAGAVLLWAAFPPGDWPWLAWLAPLPWLWLVRQPQLPGRLPYVALWLAGCVHWLLMLQGIRLAHPALYAGWLALAAYLGVYLPLFVGLTRVAVHRRRVSIVVAAPVVWVGLELIRGHLITGFSLGLLAHTQAEIPWLIQISDLAGGYTLSFVIMLVAACVVRVLGPRAWGRASAPAGPEAVLAVDRAAHERAFTIWPLAVASAALAATLVYGGWRLAQVPPGASGPTAHVALIQGALDTVFDISPERARETFDHYRRLTDEAAAMQPNLDLVVWPESMFMEAEHTLEEPFTPPPGSPLTPAEIDARLTQLNENFRGLLAGEARRANSHTDASHPGTQLLIATTTYQYCATAARTYNAALLADSQGNVVQRYYKTHPVMFGEYIPFGEALPWLYRLTPLASGLSCGAGPQVFTVAGLRLSPSVCFESTVPHLIRGQLAALDQRRTPADCLVNVTNDGWFWGSSILDLHFRCGIFRAVENRKPLIVAANTGISTWVDGNGVVRVQGPRRTAKPLLAAIQADGRRCLFARFGDWPAWLFAAACLALAIAGLRPNLRKMPKLP